MNDKNLSRFIFGSFVFWFFKLSFRFLLNLQIFSGSISHCDSLGDLRFLLGSFFVLIFRIRFIFGFRFRFSFMVFYIFYPFAVWPCSADRFGYQVDGPAMVLWINEIKYSLPIILGSICPFCKYSNITILFQNF